ncbi:MAG: TylF/MycF/NovP-related O-methyltransferase, partial [Planctomycetota bacterium]
PFLERDGRYWGQPPDDATAMYELERMRKTGADFIAFACSGIWWLDHYAGFHHYLRSNFPCSVDPVPLYNAVLVVFDLRRRGTPILTPAWSHRRPIRVIMEFNQPERYLTPKFHEAILALTDQRGPEHLGDYLEFGVYIGTSLWCMFRVISELRFDRVRFFGFDSFEGYPDEALTNDGPWKPKQDNCDIKLTRKFLTEKGVDWNRVFLVKGWFSDTLSEEVVERHNISKASIINIDCDLYSSALQALRFCAPLILDEAIIFFSGWNANGLAEKNLGEKRAFNEFLDEYDFFEVADFGNYSHYGASFRVKRKNRDYR